MCDTNLFSLVNQPDSFVKDGLPYVTNQKSREVDRQDPTYWLNFSRWSRWSQSVHSPVKNIRPLFTVLLPIKESFFFFMPEKRELTKFERGEIIGLWKGGHGEWSIEEILEHPKFTIRDTIRHLVKIVEKDCQQSLE